MVLGLHIDECLKSKMKKFYYYYYLVEKILTQSYLNISCICKPLCKCIMCSVTVI